MENTTPVPCYLCGNKVETGIVKGVGTFVASCSRRSLDGYKNCSNWTAERATEAEALAEWDEIQKTGPILTKAIGLAYKDARQVVHRYNLHDDLVAMVERASKIFHLMARSTDRDGARALLLRARSQEGEEA